MIEALDDLAACLAREADEGETRLRSLHVAPPQARWMVDRVRTANEQTLGDLRQCLAMLFAKLMLGAVH